MIMITYTFNISHIIMNFAIKELLITPSTVLNNITYKLKIL